MQNNFLPKCYFNSAFSLTKDCGWLVVHDENAHSQIFPLKVGINIVGRKSPSKPCEVMIDTQDSFMSRNHCQVEVLQRGNGYLYVIKDLGSQNGVFINADRNSRLKKDDEVYLQNGDTVQIGRTKVVLKVPTHRTPNKESAHTQVVNSDFSKTVIL
jgi:pSer/pThr/pTyr-binding forkhead associated (FHA) protein